VRQALLYALDRDRLVLDVLRGQGARADSPIPPASWAHAPSLTRYDADSSLAGLLLDEAGWTLNEDGVRQKDGQALSFTLLTNSDPVRAAAAEAIAGTWNRIGLQVRVSVIGVTALVRDHIEPRDYEAAIWARVPAVDPDPYLQWHSSQRTGKGANLAGFSNEQVDAILEEARLGSTAQRREQYAEFQELFAQEVPAIPLYVSTATYVQQAALQGMRISLLADPGDRFWQVQEWFLRTR
jgi:peptide/nickel transport system substrate-binding protein